MSDFFSTSAIASKVDRYADTELCLPYNARSAWRKFPGESCALASVIIIYWARSLGAIGELDQLSDAEPQNA